MFKMSEKECRFCRISFHISYDEHNRSCSKIPYRCRLCGRGFTSNWFFESHVQRCQTDLISCSQCDFRGSRREMLSHQHCQFCDDSSAKSWIEHEKVCYKNPKNITLCTLCKGYFTKDTFSDHECVIICERCDDSVDPGRKDLHPCFQAKKIAKLSAKIERLESLFCDRSNQDRSNISDTDLYTGNSITPLSSEYESE